MLYLFYAIFFFLILRFTVTLFNFISNPKLTKSPKPYNDFVSILIPARNEEDNIANLLQSIKSQNYQNIEVIVLDDDSTDNTFKICKEFNHDSRFKVIKGEPLDNGWLGKNFACHQLAKHANGKYLMFLDADDEIKDDLINNSIYRMQIGKLSLLSLFTNQKTLTLGEKSTVPLMHFLLLNLLPLRLVKLSKNPSFSAASGQFMLFNASDYKNHRWHQKVKNVVVEDIEIMKCVKKESLNGEALLANGFIFTRMYKNYDEALSGFSKNLLAGFNNNVVSVIIYLFFVILGPLLILTQLNFQLICFTFTLILLTRIMVSYLSGQKPIMNVFWHVPQMVNLIIISVLSMTKAYKRTVVWKGRNINR